MSAAEPLERVPPERVREALDAVLADDRFRENPILAWIGSQLAGLRDALFGSGGVDDLGYLLSILGWVVLGISVVVLTILIASRVGRRARTAGLEPTFPDAVHERVAELLAAARAAEASGDRVRALRLYFFALVVGLGERGELRYRDAWTNRELLERGRPSAGVRARLTPIVADLDRKSFGTEPVGVEDVRRLEGLCTAWLTSGRGT